jgi:hypothetical protein
MAARGLERWYLQMPGWFLLAYLVYAQAIPAFDYELGVRMGTQESAQTITEVGAAFWYGFAFSDLVIYIPLLGAGLIGHMLARPWWRVIFGAALGINGLLDCPAGNRSMGTVRTGPDWHHRKR